MTRSSTPGRASGASRDLSTPRPAPTKKEPVAKEKPKGGLRSSVRDFFATWRRLPLTNYYIILITVTILTGLGIVMVMSSSMVTSLTPETSVWSTATRQAIMVLLGFVAMWAALRTRPATIRRYSGALLFVAILMLILVLIPGVGTGRAEVGSQSWLNLGPISFQPSELARVTIAIWGAHYLADQRPGDPFPVNRMYKFSAVALGMAMLIFLEGDVGMAVSFLLIVAIMLLFAGLNLRFLGVFAIIGVAGFAALIAAGGFRSHRFVVFKDALFGHFEDVQGTAYQGYQGALSLADGGLFGVGLGQSRAKWYYLPEAKNDFIFAIIGEELGFVGASLVVALFCILGVMGLRTARHCSSQFLTLLAATLTSGVVVQAFINIGYVSGALPVTGIQLPMISAGGTSAIITLAAMGVLANCARHEPEAISAMASYGRPKIDQLLWLSEPSVDDLDVYQPRKPVRVRAEAPRTPVRAPRPAVRHSRPEVSQARPEREQRYRERPNYRQRPGR